MCMQWRLRNIPLPTDLEIPMQVSTNISGISYYYAADEDFLHHFDTDLSKIDSINRAVELAKIAEAQVLAQN